MKLKKILENISFNRVIRTNSYINKLEENVKIRGRNDKKNLKVLKTRLKKITTQYLVLIHARIVFLIILYASIITSLVGNLWFLSTFTESLLTISGILGSAICLLLIAALTKLIDVNVGDMNVVVAHTIAIYTKNDDENHPKFIKFIKKLS